MTIILSSNYYKQQQNYGQTVELIIKLNCDWIVELTMISSQSVQELTIIL